MRQNEVPEIAEIPEKIESKGIPMSLLSADTAEFLMAYRSLKPFGKMIVCETVLMLKRGASKQEFAAFVTSLMDHEEFPAYRILPVNSRENWPIDDAEGGATS